MSVPFIFSKRFLIFLAHLNRISCFAENSFEEINITWVMDGMEFPRSGMGELILAGPGDENCPQLPAQALGPGYRLNGFM